LTTAQDARSPRNRRVVYRPICQYQNGPELIHQRRQGDAVPLAVAVAGSAGPFSRDERRLGRTVLQGRGRRRSHRE